MKTRISFLETKFALNATEATTELDQISSHAEQTENSRICLVVKVKTDAYAIFFRV